MTEREQNQQVADAICDGFEWRGQRFQPGQCVALLDGEVVGVASALDEACRVLRDIDADPQRGMLVEVRRPVVEVIR